MLHSCIRRRRWMDFARAWVWCWALTTLLPWTAFAQAVDPADADDPADRDVATAAPASDNNTTPKTKATTAKTKATAPVDAVDDDSTPPTAGKTPVDPSELWDAPDDDLDDDPDANTKAGDKPPSTTPRDDGRPIINGSAPTVDDDDDDNTRRRRRNARRRRTREGTTTSTTPGLDDTGTFAVMGLAGLGVGVVGLPAWWVLGIFSFGLVPPLIVGYVMTWIGDAISKKRGAAVFPMLAGTGVMAVASGVAAASVMGIYLGPSVGWGGGGFSSLLPCAFTCTYGVLALSPVLAAAAAAAAYVFTAEDKMPGDPGGGLPGLFEPNHLRGPFRYEHTIAPTLPTQQQTAMAF
mgnify:CR=1 FL=1